MSRVLFVESGGVKLDFLGGHFALGSPSTSHTFTDVDLGAASPSGLLVIGAGALGATSNPTAVLVNGNAATSVVNASAGGRGSRIYQITGESGTGDVQVQSTNAASHFFLGLWKLRGVQNTTAFDSDQSVGALGVSPVSVSLDIPKIGVGIAFFCADATSSATTWAGLLEDYERTDDTNRRSSGASLKPTTTQTGLTVSETTTLAGRAALVAASWR